MTGGDYFDYLPMPSNGVGIAVGDVCGHGLASALIMAETRAFLRPLAAQQADPAETLSRLNAFLYQDLQEDGHFVTLFLGCLDTAARRLVYASAGHPPGFLLGATGALKAALGATGCPLGLFCTSGYESSETLEIEPGDVLVLLTDGITETEAPDGTVFGTEGALDVIRACLARPAAEIVQCLRDAVTRFSDGMPQRDDVTIVICKALDA
jgi:sigma-B regulation protein RsbU (phosphoserine phosphatase)